MFVLHLLNLEESNILIGWSFYNYEERKDKELYLTHTEKEICTLQVMGH